MPTCTATATKNAWAVNYGPWVIGTLTRTAAGFTFEEARGLDTFTTEVFADAKTIQAAIADWYAGQAPCAA